MATVHALAKKFIGEAQKNPDEREAIFRQAAYMFVGLAQDPKNVRSQEKLAKIGLDFAHAAGREQKQFTTDDFTDLLKETHQAYDEVGDDHMDLIARRRQIHDERDPERALQIGITPETFNRDATLGRSAQIKGDPTAEDTRNGITQTQNVAFWQGTKKEAQAMTVDVSLGVLPVQPANFVLPPDIDPVTPVAAPPHQRLFGEVEYGSDGNRTKVRFDMGYGRRFTVVGNYIAVTVGIDFPSQAITCGASIGAFAAASPAPLICTAYADAVTDIGTPGSAVVLPVPLKSVLLLPLLSTLGNGGTARLDFLDSIGGVAYHTFYTQGAPQQTPIPITGEVAYVRVVNLTGPAGATYNFRFPFQLSM